MCGVGGFHMLVIFVSLCACMKCKLSKLTNHEVYKKVSTF